VILLAGIALGALVTWALGGDLTRLAAVQLRATGLVFASLAVQILLFSRLAAGLSNDRVAAVHIFSYCLLLAFAALNLRRSGAWLLSAGLASNAAAILANGGRMPVMLSAWRAAGLPARLITRASADGNNVLIGPHTNLAWLSDRFALPPSLPGATVLSVGDVLIVVGLIGFIYRTCAPAPGQERRAVLAPLRVAGFRRVLAGRLASTFGDWLALTAVVTWMFARSHSTAAVSAFMVARILAAILGSGASAPLLDRFSGFRVLAFVEATRGLVTVVMIPLVAAGQVWPVVALVCVSSFLGSATSPSARSLVPDIVPDEHLHQANALHGVARNTTMVAGSLVAAVSVVQFGIETALVIDIATFLLAAGLYARFPAGRAPRPDGPRQTRREIARMIAGRRTATALIGSFTLATAAIGLLNASLPDLLWSRFGEANAYGYALAAIGAGLMVGELLSGFIRHDMLVRRSIPLAFVATAALILLVSASPLLVTAVLALAFLGAADGVTEITYDTLLQRDIPAGSRGGAFALGSAIQNGGMIVGLAAASLVATSTDAARIAAVICAAAAPVAAVGLLRKPELSGARKPAAPAPPPTAADPPSATGDDPGWDTAAGALLRRIAGVAGVHIYELEYHPDGSYHCRVWVGDAVETLLDELPDGVDPEDAWESCVHPDDRAAYDAAVGEQQQGRATELEYRLCGYRGSVRWVWERCHPRVLADGRVLVDGIVTDITRRRRLQDELTATRDRLAAQVRTDPLTGLPNRLDFAAHLEDALAAAAHSQGAVGILFIDLDGFKRVNDHHGHELGDDLLLAAARRLLAITPGCRIARLGGDEFLVLLPPSATAADVREQIRVARNRIRASLSREYTIHASPIRIGASIGAAVYPVDAADPAALVRHADADMYRDKRVSGRQAA
jgi:diguanylate cyclase (GGDEF)-like protein